MENDKTVLFVEGLQKKLAPVENVLNELGGWQYQGELGGNRSDTAPTLPPRLIFAGRNVRIVHNYHDFLQGTPMDHPPAHAHVIGGGPSVRIGQNGRPLAGERELTPMQKAVVQSGRSVIRNRIGKIGRCLNYLEDLEEAVKDFPK